jgi:hypothetical protein
MKAVLRAAKPPPGKPNAPGNVIFTAPPFKKINQYMFNKGIRIGYLYESKSEESSSEERKLKKFFEALEARGLDRKEPLLKSFECSWFESLLESFKSGSLKRTSEGYKR